MNFSWLLAAEQSTNIWVWVVFGVMILAMILLTIIPNKKRQKEYQKMQNEMRVGTKVMTIGRLIGVITKVYSDGTVEIDVGTPGAPVVITINREAIAVNLTAQAEAKANAEAERAKKEAERTNPKPVSDASEDDQATAGSVDSISSKNDDDAI